MGHSWPTKLRSSMVGSFRKEDVGTTCSLVGWVHRRRDLGGLVFIDLRDRSGVIQVSFDPDRATPEALRTAGRVGAEYVVAVKGVIMARPEANVNSQLATGEIEVQADSLEILSEAATPPIPIVQVPGEELPAEDLRLRYRHLDLRREELRNALGVRHRALQAVRQHLSGEGFWEIETPMLTRRTPEGARDYLVPSRVHPGEFYALPQSPQLYKQLLMTAGYDRYFQIAKCMRDEDLRADRQPEFTQIDAEMSFVEEEDVQRVGDGLIASLWRQLLDVEVATPIPCMTYHEAVQRYGTDKPDLRFDCRFQDVTDILRDSDFRLFAETGGTGARIRGIRIPEGGAALSRKDLDGLAPIAQSAGASGALWVRRTETGLTGQFARGLSDDLAGRFMEHTGMRVGDLFVLVVGQFRVAPMAGESRTEMPDGERYGASEAALDALRRHLGDRMGLRDPDVHSWVWITEFPLFEWDAEEGRIVAAHHPFTMPAPADIPQLEKATDAGALKGEAARALFDAGVRARAYDIVYNGHEVASGSIRIHDPVLQTRVFRALGMSEADVESKFGFLLEAFRYGAPPHGGFAFGFDRLIMLLVGAGSLRDVIAFPKTTAARALFEGAPAEISSEDLRELRLSVTRTERS